MKKIIKKYSDFVSNHAVLVLVICLCFSVLMLIGIQMMETQEIDYVDMLPDDYEVITAYELISEEFGSSESGTIVLQVDNSYANSNEYQSVLEPDVVRYSLVLEAYFLKLEYVEDVNGFGQLVNEEYGYIPNDILSLRESREDYGTSYISEDESMALIQITFESGVDGELATKEISELVEQIDTPAGITVGLAGDVFEDVIVEEQLLPDISRTSVFSIIAIILILILLFRSLKGVVMPLMTIIFGVLWTMGFLGLIGSGISSMTSGAISMIMGIGIDFGIQIMNRYNQELKKFEKKTAMSNTLSGTLMPILTTALACLIGFQAMNFGELSMMAELGNIMSLGIVFCMFAAITIVPSLLVLLTRKVSKTNS